MPVSIKTLRSPLSAATNQEFISSGTSKDLYLTVSPIVVLIVPAFIALIFPKFHKYLLVDILHDKY